MSSVTLRITEGSGNIGSMTRRNQFEWGDFSTNSSTEGPRPSTLAHMMGMSVENNSPTHTRAWKAISKEI